MSDDSNKLLESLMGALGDNPAETLGQMLSSLSGASDSSQGEQQEESAESEKADNGGFDLDMLLKLQGMMGALQQGGRDERSALLSALRPFLSEERQPKVDQAIKLLKLSQLAKTAQEMDLFKNLL